MTGFRWFPCKIFSFQIARGVASEMNLSCLLLIAVLPLAFGLLEFNDWQCGSEEINRRAAYNSVTRSCPSLATEVNHCCVIHDDCYARQAGQEKCDEDFCACNERVLNVTEGAGCRDVADFACIMMDLIGHFAYKDSANYTEPADLPKHVPSEFSAFFSPLYTHCPHVNSTLSSCALLYENCNNNEAVCSSQLCDCAHSAYAMDHEPTCKRAVDRLCFAVHNPVHDKAMSSFTSIATVLGVIFMLIVSYVVWRRRRRNIIKYSTVVDL